MEFIKKTTQTVLEKKEKEGVTYLTFPLLEELGIVEHCFTTRMGGVSKGIYATMNLSFSRGDEEEAVLENYRRIASVMHTSIDRIVCSDQTHTTNVLQVDASYGGCGITKARPYSDMDGLITNETGVMLATFYADCVPLYFVDPVHKAIGLSHSGWKGTVGRMGAKTLKAMQDAYGTEAKDVYAAVAPSICQSCYEISEDVAIHFSKEFSDWKDSILEEKGGGKFQLDLWKTNELILLEAGIRKEHLAVTNICTCCNPTLLFSHRASKGQRGNLGAFLMLK